MNKTPDLTCLTNDQLENLENFCICKGHDDLHDEVIAENRRRQAIRDAAAAAPAPQEWFAKWEATRPQGQWGRWHISDRD